MNKMRGFLALLGLLVVSSFITMGSAISETNFSYEIFETDETNDSWLEEGISVSMDNEGNIWADYGISGSTVFIGDNELESLVSNELLNFLDYVSLHYYPSENINQDNLYFEASFRTPSPEIAQELGHLLIELIEAETILLFDLSSHHSFEYWDGDQQQTGVTIVFAAQVELGDLIPFVLSTLVDYDLFPVINLDKVQGLSLNIWRHYEGELAASVNFHFYSQLNSPGGNHVLSLNDITGFSEFKRSPLTTQPFRVHVHLPSVENPMFDGFTPGENVVVEWEEYVEEDDSWWTGTITISEDAVVSTILVNFDYEVELWVWQNHDNAWWYIGRRGYESIQLQAHGKDRIAPSADLAHDSALMVDTLYFELDLDVAWQSGSLTIIFTGNETRESEFSSILSAIQNLGLELSNFNVQNATTEFHLWASDQNLPAREYHGHFDLNSTHFTDVVSNLILTSNSSLLENADLTQFNEFEYRLDQHRWGIYPYYNLEFNSLDNPAHPSEISPRFSGGGTHTIDPLNLPFLNLVDDFPWNNASHDYSIFINEPFDGNKEAVQIAPDKSWGAGWWRNFWFNDYDGRDRFKYELYIHDEELQTVDNNNEPTGVVPDFGIEFDLEFATADDDMVAPKVNEIAWRDTSVNDEGYGNHDSWRRDFEQSFSGEVDMIAIVQDIGAEGYWYNETSDEWIEMFPSSGIATVEGSLVYGEVPAEHDLFRIPLEFTDEGLYDNPDAQVYKTGFDSSQIPDGHYGMRITTSDNAGNKAIVRTFDDQLILIDNFDESFTPADLIWDVDFESGNIVDGTLDISFNTEDDAGVYAAIVWINAAGYIIQSDEELTGDIIRQSFNYALNTEAYEDGTPLFIWVQVLDYDGHWSYSSEILVFAGEPPMSDPPAIELLTPLGDITVDATEQSTIEFQVVVEDDFGTQQPKLILKGPADREFTFTEKEGNKYTLVVNVANWAGGEYEWYVEVTDIGFATNTVSTEIHVLTLIQDDSVVVDTEPPVLSILQPEELTGLSGEVTFEVEATDNVGIQEVTIEVSGFEYSMEPLITGRYTRTIDTSIVPDGEYTALIKATDTSGLSTSIEITVSFENGNTREAPGLGIPLQVPWLWLILPVYLVRRFRRH